MDQTTTTPRKIMQAPKKRRMGHVSTLVAALDATATLCACGDGDNSRASSAPAPAPAPAIDPSEGCGTPPPSQTSNLHVLDGNGVQRSFDIVVSPGYNPSQPVPVVFVFHGAGGSSAGALSFGFQDAIRNAGDQAIVVAPQGVPFQNFGVGWNESCTGYDMAFFDEMLKYVGQKYCIDRKRVHATGFSWGSDMTNALACCRGAKLKGISPVSGPEGLGRSCPTPRGSFPAVRYRYGDADFAYGSNALAQHAATVASYTNLLSCGGGTDTVPPGTCKTYRNCAQPLMECKVPGLGHVPLSPDETADTWTFWKSLR